MTTTTLSFSTIDEVFAACDEAKIMHRTQRGGLGETTYWVDDNHRDIYAPMTCFYSEQQLIRWANYFFNTDHDDIEEDEEGEYEGGIAYNSLH
jgi:hypothetical protein